MRITLSKKIAAVLALGTILTFGSSFSAFAQNGDFSQQRPALHQQKTSPEIIRQLGLSQTDFEKYQAKGYHRKDVVHAAFLAKVSEKSIDTVLSYKTEDTTWKYVEKKLGVTQEQIKATRQNMAADGISIKTNADKTAVLNLFSQGYHARDIMMAAELAKLSTKSMDEVISMKKINNTWRDIANSLGVKPETIKEDFKAMRSQKD